MALVALPHPQLARATEGELAPEAQADEAEQLADGYEAQAQAEAVDPAADEPTLVAPADEDSVPEEDSAEAATPAEEPALTAQADDFDGDIWLEGDDDVFSDGTLTMWLRQSGTIEDPYVIHVAVGSWPGEPDWDDLLNEGEAYTYDAETGKIVFDGAWLFDHGYDHAQVFVSLAWEPADVSEDDWQLIDGEDRWIDVREAREEYDREWDRDVLPGWMVDVRKFYHVHVEDTAHPESFDGDYEVTDVEIISQRSDEGDVDVFALEDTDGGWHYRAETKGEATFKVTYLDIDGHEQSYEFTCNVTGRTFGLDVWAKGSATCIPGEQIELRAQAIDYREGEDEDFEGFSYTWEIADQDTGIIPMPPAVQYPEENKVIIGTNNLQNGTYGDGYSERHFRVVVKAYKDGYETERDFWISVVTQYPEIWFRELDDVNLPSYLPLGESITVTPEIHYFDVTKDNNYPSGSSRGIIANYVWYFDENCLSITDWNGNVVHEGDEVAAQNGLTPNAFTIKRIGDWDTDLGLDVNWIPSSDQMPEFADEWGQRHEHGNYSFERLDCDLWFDDAKHDIDLWATRNEDGSFSDISPDVTNALFLSDDLAEIDGLAINWTVGTWENDEWDQIFGPESGLYTIGADGKSITSNAAAMAEQGVRNLRVTASARLGDVERETHNDFWFHLRERQTDIEREWDTDMLPGDVSTVNRWYHYRFEDEEFPEGIDGDYEVTNVTTSDPAIVSVRLSEWGEGDQADHNWRYTAEDMGTATLTVFYQLPDGTEDSYTFDVHVAGDVYFVDIWSEDGAYNVLPGSTVELHAQGTHRRQGQPDTDEGLTYSWGIVEGGDICSLVVDPNDPQHATVTVMTPAEAGKMGFADNVTVRVCLHDGADEVARNDWECWVTNRFQGVYPTTIDRMLRIGQSEQVNLEVREYLYGRDDFTTIDGAEFAFHFDGDCVSIADASGNKVTNSSETADEVFYPAGTYTITRKGVWETGIGVNARWTEGNERRFCFQGWLLDRPNYEMAFGAPEYQANENCAAAIKLDVSNVSDVPGYADNLHLNIGTGWDDAQQAFAHELAESEYSLDKADDVWTITVPGTVLKQRLSDWGCDSLDVFALLVMEGEYSLWTGAETSVTTTTANTHAISHVDAVAPHDGENGVAEHWRCDNCGATFADAAGTQPVSADDLVVEPAEQTITASDKVVAFGGTIALGAKASGGGALSYKSSNTGIATVNANGVVTPVKAGKVNITITAAAAGTYKAASKTITVTINKGTNPMVAKAKAKSFQASKTKKTTIKKTKAFTITGAQGKVTFKKVKGDKKITVSKTGKITVKKGLTKKTYKVKIQVTAAGNANYNPVTKTITVKIKMK